MDQQAVALSAQQPICGATRFWLLGVRPASATVAYCNHSVTLLPLRGYKCSVEARQGRLIASTPLSFCHESSYDYSELSSPFSAAATFRLGRLCRQPHDRRDLADQLRGYLGANVISFPFCFCSHFVRLPFPRSASRMALISNTTQSFERLAPRSPMLCSLTCTGPGSRGFPKMPPS